MRKAFTVPELLLSISISALVFAIAVTLIHIGRKQSVAQTQSPRFTVTRTLIDGGHGSAFVITLRDSSTGKEYIGIPDTTLVEVPRSATSSILCEAPITK